MSSISSSFQDHIDAGNNKSCQLVLKEKNMHSEQYNKDACESALSQIGDSACSGENDMFSLKLTQISSQQADTADNCQTKKEKKSSPQKSAVGPDNLLEQAMAIESFLQAQRVALIKSLTQDMSEEQRREALNSFFDVLQNQTRNLTRQIKTDIATRKPKKSSPIKSPSKKTSPKKSPQKKENEVDAAYGSPSGKECARVGLSFYSPGKQSQNQNRSSQQRRQKHMDEEGAEQENVGGDGQYSIQTSTSPCSEKLALPKSPVKRMRQLEEQQNEQDHEDVETAYQKSPCKALTSVQLTQNNNEQEDTVEKEETLKSLLTSKEDHQEPVQTESQEEQNVVDINEVLDIDSNVINYGQFICGKILGSTLLLTNISDEEQVITMSISRQQTFDCDGIFGQYNRDELPFDYNDGAFIKNSEIEFNCWFIENPITKELQKQITLKIGAQMSQEFIIVIKAPKNRLQAKIVSFIDIQMCNDDSKTPVEKHVKHSSSSVAVKDQPIPRKLEILLLGFLDNPKIKCMKQLFNEAANSELISLAVKKAGGIQKFKLPFKNLSTYLDSDIEFAFIRAPQAAHSQSSKQGSASKNSFCFEPVDCLQFYCQPNQFKISADQIQILTVQIKVNNDMLLDAGKVDQKLLRYPLNKLLVARLKNSQILFSFFVSLTLVD